MKQLSWRFDIKQLKAIKWINTLSVDYFLYAIVLLNLLGVILVIASRFAMNKSLAQDRITDQVLFEMKYAHYFSVRDVDVTLRGFAIGRDERFLYKTNEFIKIDMENNFKRLDSLLRLQSYNELKGLASIEKYKKLMREYVAYHGAMIKLIKQGKMADFVKEFEKDKGAYMWPTYVDAVEALYDFEAGLSAVANKRYQLFSIGVVYFQLLIFLLSVPGVVYVVKRLKNERRTALQLEEQKLANERSKVKEQFLSVMSHEIRTPLNSIIGLVHVLKNRSPREDQREIIDTLKNSSDHLLHLVDDVLDYNRIQANSLLLEAMPFYLDELLRHTRSLFHHIASEKNISFAVQLDPSTPLKLMGDPTRLIQILNNLIVNALKFTTMGSVRLQITPIAQEADFVVIEFLVLDTGIGIASDKISLIFQPFAQAEQYIHRMYGGTGLGLVIVKNLTELMGGKVEIESTVGQGSSFKVTIPFQLQPRLIENKVVSGEQQDDKTPLKNCTVLYVEDVVSNQFLVNSLLSDWGAIFENASNGREALELIYKNTFDIILLDIQLPDTDGYELAMHIRNNHFSFNQYTPIILFSAYSDINQDQIVTCGANDFIGKPFTPEKLLTKIRKLINKK